MEQFEKIGPALLVRAPAKINLSLLIAGKRPDGFHELKTIMAKIDWMDELLFEPTDKPGIDLTCTGPCWAPDGEENLVYRACQKLYDHIGKPPRVKVTLKKNIPAGTGLGSASSDAAAALLGLNRFENLALDSYILYEFAAQLGSDIPFFLYGPLAFCTGRGEKIQQINKIVDFSALLIIPSVSVSTASVYKNYIHENEQFIVLENKINRILKEKNVDSVAEICANMLEKSCFQLHGELKQLRSHIKTLCNKEVCLSGSGSALFMLFPRDDDLVSHYHSVISEQLGCRCRIVYNNRW